MFKNNKLLSIQEKVLNYLDYIGKYRGSIVISVWAALLLGDVIINHKSIVGAILVFLFLTPILLFFQLSLCLSINILFMSTFTFLSIPALIALVTVFITKIASIQTLLISICGTSLLMYLILLIKHKLSDEFLDNAKISLDIVRTIFAILLAIATIYSVINNDFSFFKKFIIDFNNKNLDEIKKIFQLICQSIALPFVISSSLLKIATDWIILSKKRGTLSRLYYLRNKSLIIKFLVKKKSPMEDRNV